MDNFEIGNVEWFVAILVVLTNAAVVAILLFLNSTLGFSPSSLTAAAGLADIDFEWNNEKHELSDPEVPILKAHTHS